jgi:hypothetical protein
MTTRLGQKAIHRRVGDLMLDISEFGVVLRKSHQNGEVYWTWEELAERLDRPRGRSEAFQRPLPRGWLPAVGEDVYVRALSGYLSNCVSRGLVLAVATAVPEPLVRVRLRYGRGKSEDQYTLSNLRPIGPGSRLRRAKRSAQSEEVRRCEQKTTDHADQHGSEGGGR